MSADRGIPLRYLAAVNPPTPELGRLGPGELVSHLPLSAVWPDGQLDLSRVLAVGEAPTSYSRVREGDILFPKVTPSFEHNRVAVARGLVNGFALASTEVHVVRPLAPELAELLHYRLRAADFQALGRAEMLGVAGLRRVPEAAVRALRVPREAIRRQREVVSFLDDSAARLMSLRQRLSELERRAAETRSALVEEAAGAPAPGPRVPLWSVVDPARPVMYGIVLPGPHDPSGVPLIKGGDVHGDRLQPDRLSRTSRRLDEKHSRSRVRAGDVLLTIRGSFGAAAVVAPELEGANLTQDTARLAPGPGLSSAWLCLALQAPSVQDRLLALSTGASIKGITIRDLKKVRIPVPPLAEQRRIARSLEARLGRLADLAQRAARMRELSGEYRDSLITERFLRPLAAAEGDQPEVGAEARPGRSAALVG